MGDFMRKKNFFTFLLLIFTILTLGICLSANNDSVAMLEGASIRAAGEQGLRYTAQLSSSYKGSEHGFYIIYGKATVADLITAKHNNTNLINDKEYYKKTINSYKKDLTFSVVLIGIPDIGYDDNITVLAFINQGTKEVYSNNETTRSVTDVARGIYDSKPLAYEGQLKEFVDSIVSTRKIKITHSNNNVNYYKDFNDSNFNLNSGDTIELTRGTFSAPLVIDKNDIAVYGLNKDIKVSSTGGRLSSKYLNESIYKATGGITIEKGVKNVHINGLSFESNRAIIFKGKNSNVLIEHNLIKVNGNFGICDVALDTYKTDDALKNINIVGNFFTSSAQVYFRDINFTGFVKSVNIYNNHFDNHRDQLNINDYAIRLLRYTEGAQVDIYNNNFRKYGASYVIDVGYSNGTSDVKDYNHDININIENNSFSSSYTKVLAANAIRVLYLGDNSTVTIINNTNIRTSPYFNAIMLSGGYRANYDEKIDNVKVEILYNRFYAAAFDEITKPEGRNTVETRYTRIGLGLPVYSDITIDKNYYGSSTSRTAYTNNTTASTLTSNNRSALQTNKVASGSKAETFYNEHLNSFSIRLTNYLKLQPFNNVSSAHYWGLDHKDIKTYINNFNDKDINVLEIHNNEITFVGREQYLFRIANNNNVKLGSLEGINRLEDIVVNIAYMFYEQRSQIQYDQNSGRRMLGGRPELATSEKEYYSDCSAFVSDVYLTAFDLPIYPDATNTSTNTRLYMEYAKDNQSNVDVIAYVQTKDYTTASNKQNKLDEIYKVIVPGDVIVYRYDNFSKGHAMLYVGDEKILHVTGASYDFEERIEKYEENGAVKLISTKVFTDSSDTRYLFRNQNDEFCILRPLANNPTLTNDGKNRNLVKGLDLEKKANVGSYSGVSIGDEITYSLIIKNTSETALKDFFIRDTLSKQETFVSIDKTGTRNGDNISFYVDNIKASETKIFKYTIKVKKDSPSDTQLSSTKAKVFEIRFNPLYFTILEYTPEELNTLNNRIQNAEGTSRNLEQLLKYLYGNNHPIVYDTMTKIYDNSAEFRPRDLWGGKNPDRSSTWNTVYRIRLLKKSHLTVGDIIIAKRDTSTFIYIYSPSKILTYQSGGTTRSINLDLQTVIGNDNYRVFRPTIKKV